MCSPLLSRYVVTRTTRKIIAWNENKYWGNLSHHWTYFCKLCIFNQIYLRTSDHPSDLVSYLGTSNFGQVSCCHLRLDKRQENNITSLKMPRDSDSSGSCSPVHVTRSPSPKSQKISPFSIASILASSSNHSPNKSKDDPSENLISPDTSLLARWGISTVSFSCKIYKSLMSSVTHSSFPRVKSVLWC